jgi:Flp pilus assembly protein TadG
VGRENLRGLLTGLGRDRSGGVVVLFAVALIGLTMFIGLALDYGRAVLAKSTLKTAADAAALTALSTAERDYVNNAGSAQMIQDAQAAARRAFIANAGKYYSDLTPSPANATCANPCIAVAVNGLTVTADVSFQASAASLFGGWTNIPFIDISQVNGKSSVAQEKLPAYANFYLLLDNTPSMGVGATANDIQNLVNLTTNLSAKVNGHTYYNPNEAQCGFACHQTNPCSASSPPSDCGTTTTSKNNYQNNVFAPYFDYLTIARNNNVTLRIDLLRQAAQNLMALAANIDVANQIPNELQFAVYSFGATATAAHNNAIAAVAPLSANTSVVATQVQSLDLMSIDYQNQYGDQQTSFDTAVPALNAILPNPGDGTSASSPQEYVIIVSDGVTDESLNGSRTIGPINTALCTAIKNRGIQIATLYTTYYNIPNNSFFTAYVAPYLPPQSTTDKLAAAMKSCASSPELFQQVDVGGSISQALQNIFNQLMQRSRLTQ